MKITFVLLLSLAAIAGACATRPANTTASQQGSQPPMPKDGDYKGSGKVIKIDLNNASVEIDHGDIPGLMPPMQMEFFVSDKALLSGLTVGDDVDFTILYKGGTETITKLTRK